MELNIYMIVDKLLISHIYAAHPTVLSIHNLWNTDINLTTFSQGFLHVDLFILVNSWTPPKTVLGTHHRVDCSDQ